MIHMIGFGSTPVEFKNGKVFSFLQIFNGLAFYVVSPIVKQGTVADGIKDLSKDHHQCVVSDW